MFDGKLTWIRGKLTWIREKFIAGTRRFLSFSMSGDGKVGGIYVFIGDLLAESTKSTGLGGKFIGIRRMFIVWGKSFSSFGKRMGQETW